MQPLPQSFDLSDAWTSPCIIKGKGQKVYWRNCAIKLFIKGRSSYEELHEITDGDGWVIVPYNIELRFGGEKNALDKSEASSAIEPVLNKYILSPLQTREWKHHHRPCAQSSRQHTLYEDLLASLLAHKPNLLEQL